METLEVTGTKENLIVATARFIQMKGYYGTGINEILKEVGVPKGSLYHHFPGGKHDLVIAAIEYSGRKQQAEFADAMKGKGIASAGLKALIDVLIKRMESSNYVQCCPISAVSLDVSMDNEGIREACKKVYHLWESGLLSFLNYKEVPNAEVVAKMYMNMIEGGFLLSKASKDTSYLVLIKEKTEALLNALSE